MAFTIKLRGAVDGTIVHEYLCPKHGRFAATVSRADSPDEVLCPFYDGDGDPPCSEPSPWSPSGSAAVHTQFVISTTRGKSDPKPHKNSMDLRNLGEGQKYSAWKKERRKIWQEERHKRRKAFLQ